MGHIRLTRDILRQDGETEQGLMRRVKNGEFQRVRHGAYLPREASGTPHDDHRARAEAVLRQRPDAVLAGMSAAALLGLPVDVTELSMVRVISSAGHGCKVAGVRQHNFHLPTAHVTDVDGFRVTTAARTAIDVARVTGLEWAVCVADAALHQGLASPDDLSRTLGEIGPAHRLRVARRTVELADGRAESPLESVSRVQMMRLGLPMPELQFRLDVPGLGAVRADFAWPDYGLIGECDGWSKYGALVPTGHTALDVVRAEKRRENGLRRLGWWVTRWEWTDAWSPRGLEAIIRAGFAQALRNRSGAA